MSVTALARAVLDAADPGAKCRAAFGLRTAWTASPVTHTDDVAPPNRPARPDRPVLADPRTMPRRRLGTVAGRVALLHAVAHIEFNAIDLAADMIARFSASASIPDADRADFIGDWVRVCAEEATHFGWVRSRLVELGSDYGDLPAHDGLWEAAQNTAHDLAARLAVAPMVMEARGLDVTPPMIRRFEGVADTVSAEILNKIYHDEIDHVRIGTHWFTAVCRASGGDPEMRFAQLVRDHYGGQLKPPFNESARTRAGLSPELYLPLANRSPI